MFFNVSARLNAGSTRVTAHQGGSYRRKKGGHSTHQASSSTNTNTGQNSIHDNLKNQIGNSNSNDLMQSQPYHTSTLPLTQGMSQVNQNDSFQNQILFYY